MSAWRRQSIVFAVAVLLVFAWLAAPPALAEQATYKGMHAEEEITATSMLFDLIFLRPLGLAATGVGAAAFILSLPFSALGGNTGEAAQKLVVAPAKYTFTRPLGSKE